MSESPFQPMKAGGDETILDRIVRSRKQRLPQIRNLARDLKPAKSDRSLYDALGGGKRGTARMIMECKGASPSLGLIRPNYNPAELAQVYAHYADAISVLCEPDYFGGDYAHLQAVRAVTSCPVLCKDFIIDPAQLVVARHFGADAALLMLSVLNDDQYRALAQVANELGLDVLTEVASEAEADRAVGLGARIVGINHRNLHDLSIDLSRSAHLATYFDDQTVIVAESGIKNHHTLRTISPHVSAFLVGSQLSGQPDVDKACRELLFGASKVCGLTTVEAAQAALDGGAKFGGFIPVQGSPRFITATQAAGIARHVPGLDYVVVTRERDLDAISRLVQDFAFAFDSEDVAAPFAIQLHASSVSEDPQDELAWLRAVREVVPQGWQLWRALDLRAGAADLRAGDPAALSRTNASAGGVLPLLLAEDVVDHVVADSGGGSGEVFDWTTLPKDGREKILLAGGIGADNAAEALALGAGGVDMNSRLEFDDAPAGRKSPEKIRQAFSAIHHPPATARPVVGGRRPAVVSPVDADHPPATASPVNGGRPPSVASPVDADHPQPPASPGTGDPTSNISTSQEDAIND
ncbi:MAG: bifunctional indole-3-glycerol-phosphate synthase TrpC/phosphoribosylanthranilate isomerase TrpF [Actinomycetaceae bacterium]|nr:bifunctional indole-3-glycerol-phosphate synthase TrpC/phosphoribosylanthranilate isomerase TrpF [Actinomycetaceae bacterium]